jgi:nucleotide-binding universal stress UspA family protein
MYDHILVPVSFEEERDSTGALAVARTLADEGARITLLHVIEKLPSYAASYVPTDYVQNARAAIEGELARMAEGLPGGEVRVVEGHAGRTILDWAAEHAPDCIVIASHRPGMQDLLLGSTATQIVRHATCAVHVIR